MKTANITWDFDGTLLPNDPYDSEQSLMLYKLYGAGEHLPLFLGSFARFMIHADNREYLRKTFKKFYAWFMKETRGAVLDRVAERLADKISDADRQALLTLKSEGHRMLVLSCGTEDLSRRTLAKAGVADCFDVIRGNRFQWAHGRITGMTFCMRDPIEKVRFLQSKGLGCETVIAVGDGYTDIPLLDWAGRSIMLDRSGKKQKRYHQKKYQFISSIAEILDLLDTDKSEFRISKTETNSKFKYPNGQNKK